MDRQEAFELHRRRREIADQLMGRPNRRQRQEAAQGSRQEQSREPSETFVFQWDDEETWNTPRRSYPIQSMEDAHLWQTVIWCVRNLSFLFKAAGQPTCIDRETRRLAGTPANIAPGLAAARWLAARPTFRALVRESIRRAFTYPGDVVTFLKAYLLNHEESLDGYQPWRDPSQEAQVADLAPLRELPLQPPRWDIGKPLRIIELGDEKETGNT